jgi:selenocysteine lyase/cysteine desulfurase
MQTAVQRMSSPGRGGYPAAVNAANTAFRCREELAALFHVTEPERVVFTMNATHGLNVAIRSLVRSGGSVVISGFEHNAVTRTLYGCEAKVRVAGRRLFDWENTLEEFENGLKAGADAAVFTHVSNVFGYILPVRQMGQLCRQYGVPFVLDAAQSAGSQTVNLEELGADYIAMPGHKGLLGPQGTGILLCAAKPKPLLMGGTGNMSVLQDMPPELPERLEPGTLNVPGIAGLRAGLDEVLRIGTDTIGKTEEKACKHCIFGLKKLGFRVFEGEHQGGTVSFLPREDCQILADRLAQRGIAVRSGLHCAPLAHESAGTLETGTVRVSFGHRATTEQTRKFLEAAQKLVTKV